MDAAKADFLNRLNRANIRFAVCGPKAHSSSWTAFEQGNDYYIGARGLMGFMPARFAGWR